MAETAKIPVEVTTRFKVDVEFRLGDGHPCHANGCCCLRLEHRLDKMERQLREILRRLPDPATVPAHITLKAS